MVDYRKQLDEIQVQIDKLEAQKKEIKKKENAERIKRSNEFINFLRENRDVVLGLFPESALRSASYRGGWYTNHDGRVCIEDSLGALQEILDSDWEDMFEICFDVCVTPINGD